VNASVVVTYTVRPETVDEHRALIAGVFDELAAGALPDVDYAVYQQADGVSFVHVATSWAVDGAIDLPKLASFQAFSETLAARVTGPPRATAGQQIAHRAAHR
jgi:hypothetical protein